MHTASWLNDWDSGGNNPFYTGRPWLGRKKTRLLRWPGGEVASSCCDGVGLTTTKHQQSDRRAEKRVIACRLEGKCLLPSLNTGVSGPSPGVLVCECAFCLLEVWTWKQRSSQTRKRQRRGKGWRRERLPTSGKYCPPMALLERAGAWDWMCSERRRFPSRQHGRKGERSPRKTDGLSCPGSRLNQM